MKDKETFFHYYSTRNRNLGAVKKVLKGLPLILTSHHPSRCPNVKYLLRTSGHHFWWFVVLKTNFYSFATRKNLAILSNNFKTRPFSRWLQEYRLWQTDGIWQQWNSISIDLKTQKYFHCVISFLEHLDTQHFLLYLPYFETKNEIKIAFDIFGVIWWFAWNKETNR